MVTFFIFKAFNSHAAQGLQFENLLSKCNLLFSNKTSLSQTMSSEFCPQFIFITVLLCTGANLGSGTTTLHGSSSWSVTGGTYNFRAEHSFRGKGSLTFNDGDSDIIIHRSVATGKRLYFYIPLGLFFHINLSSFLAIIMSKFECCCRQPTKLRVGNVFNGCLSFFSRGGFQEGVSMPSPGSLWEVRLVPGPFQGGSPKVSREGTPTPPLESTPPATEAGGTHPTVILSYSSTANSK